MKRILLLLLSGFLCSAMAMAQISINQRGKASQELKSDGISIAHPSLPINSTVRVTNTKTGKEVDATVVDRIPASPNRIADLSPGAWQELGLSADSEIRISSIPTVRQRPSAPAVVAEPPAPAVAQAAPPPPPAQPAPQPAQNNAPAEPLNLTVTNVYESTPAPARAAPAPQPVRYAPDADLQVRLAAVSAMAQQYQQPPKVVVVKEIIKEPVQETKVVESPVYQVVVVPVYQTPPPPPPPPMPVYQPMPVIPVAPVAAVPVVPVVPVTPVVAAVPAYANLRVYPGFPDPNCGRMYYLQVASFLAPQAAARVAYMVRSAGFNVIEERALPYYRVIVPNIPAAMVYPTVQRLGATGFIEEVWVR